MKEELTVMTGRVALAAAIFSLMAMSSSSNRTLGVWCFFFAALAVFVACSRSVNKLEAKSNELVVKINTDRGLALNSKNKLGDDGPVFFVFDKSNRKLAVCNGSTGAYWIYDLNFILEWSYSWTNAVKTDLAGFSGREVVPGTGLSGPTFQQSSYKKNFVLVLNVADENSPTRNFPMRNEAAAQNWCARLNAIFNG